VSEIFTGPVCRQVFRGLSPGGSCGKELLGRGVEEGDVRNRIRWAPRAGGVAEAGGVCVNEGACYCELAPAARWDGCRMVFQARAKR